MSCTQLLAITLVGAVLACPPPPPPPPAPPSPAGISRRHVISIPNGRWCPPLTIGACTPGGTPCPPGSVDLTGQTVTGTATVAFPPRGTGLDTTDIMMPSDTLAGMATVNATFACGGLSFPDTVIFTVVYGARTTATPPACVRRSRARVPALTSNIVGGMFDAQIASFLEERMWSFADSMVASFWNGGNPVAAASVRCSNWVPSM